TSGGTVTSGLLQLSFPANSVTLNGQPYTGTVRVYAAALDPTSTAMFDQMPGELLGGMNDSLRLLRSFGMASIELRDANMNELQLANGQLATLKFNIPTALQAEAPVSIDWWSFDENLGYWIHEGEAQKQGSQYIGSASHFSWWNLDVPGTFNEFLGIVNSLQGNPVTDAKVNLGSTTLGTATTYTNSDGIFSGRVPKNQSLTLGILLTCNTTNDWTLAYSENLVSGVFPIVGTYTASLSEYYQITGTVLNCSGLPVESGYVKMGTNVFSTNEGQFNIQTCSVGEYVIRGYDTSNPDSIKASALDTILVVQQINDAVNVQACSQFFGEVSDIENNVYSTVIIGDQLWMAENLRTATYANGDPIPNVTGNLQWSNLSTGAWCNYDNNVLNDSLYGKLYNWYTVVDARNLCPTGWHVPSSVEWEVLVDLLGGELSAGGKMKSIVGWESPNQGATNESGFSGLPGGYRYYFQTGYFTDIGFYGYWWSTTTQPSTSSAWIRTLNYSDDNASLASYAKKNGLSVRCIRD
ncbi:MAG: fibrobacter succinogenes major paralogous domain-containing protein, partial [Bacteroidia bacterium]